MPDSPFPHLQLIALERGKARLHGGGTADPRTTENKAHRLQHSQKLSAILGRLGQRFQRLSVNRAKEGLPPIEGGIPFMLEIADDDELLDFLALKLGIEVVAEYADGFLMVSAHDVATPEFHAILREFENNRRGSARAASIFEIHDAPDGEDRLKRMLGDELFSQWPFEDNTEFILEASFKAPTMDLVPPEPKKKKTERADTFAARLVEWRQKYQQALVEVDQERIHREELVEQIIKHYGGVLESAFLDSVRPHPQFAELADSFSARIRMTGKGFKDLILTHPHLFEVAVPEDIALPIREERLGETEGGPSVVLLAPNANAKAICVIDSGIQENHRLLTQAIDSAASRCFLPSTPATDIADYVRDGGHGTRVAGVALYGSGIPDSGNHNAPFWIQNARVLDANYDLPSGVHPPLLMRVVVDHFNGGTRKTRVFNHSIASRFPSRRERMSAWAAELDHLSHTKDVLFIQAIGNLREQSNHTNNPGVAEHLDAGRRYPDFLQQPSARLANPAQSLQALTVGSIAVETFRNAPLESLAETGHPSAFTRSGLGLWGSIKPDVVEIGGDFVWNNAKPALLTTPPEVCPQLLRSTLNGGPAIARDSVGSSFAAPRVAHLAGVLESIFPTESTLLYRALIVQSARWPEWAEQASKVEKAKHVRLLGYGIPDVERATTNSEFRVTCVTQGVQEVHAGEAAVFAFHIPEDLRRQASEAQLRLDITLSYSAEPRRTRSSRRGYLGVWLDWNCSKPRESLETFRGRILKSLVKGEDEDSERWDWMLDERQHWGVISDVRRGDGTLQKDWAYLNSYDLPEVFGVAIRGHAGWAHRNPSATARFALAVSLESVNRDLEIYEPIRQQILQRIGEIRVETIS